MRKLSTFINSKGVLFLIIQCLFLSASLFAQQTTIKDYVLFSGSVRLGSFSNIQGGSVGGHLLVRSTGRVTINANIFSGGTVNLAHSNKVTGRITAANTPALPGPALIVGSGAILGGNIDVNGNIFIGGGTVSGRVTHPSSTSYFGPVPGGGNVTGLPQLPDLPPMPAITNFPACPPISDIRSTRTIRPGKYGQIKLQGNNTLTFSGTGAYVFDKIDNKGGFNYFILDFKNSATGTFKIYVHKDADLGKIIVKMVNGGSASRIFTEIHGNGTTCSNRTWSFNIDNGPSENWSSKWLGTVWAPYGAINIGSGYGNSKITGALWSRTQVNIQCGAKIIYEPYGECSTPDVNAGPDKPLDFEHPVTLNGSSSTSGASFSWQAINGGMISSPANAASITVTTAGTYILTVTSTTSCSATDTAIVTSKTNNIIGAELQSVIQNFDPNDPPTDFFVLQH
ncbi:MAG: hypothetical protein ABI707_15165, partial [Ferruginibacter sp.]